jgi:chromosome segregation ATPase
MEKDSENEIKLEVALIKKSLEGIDKSFETIAKHLEKLDPINQRLIDLETKIKLLDMSLDSVKNDADMRRREAENSVREIKQRMSEMSSISEKIINDKIDRVFSELRELKEDNRSSFAKLNTKIETQKEAFDDRFQEMDKRIGKLENWKWWVIGAASVVTSLFTLAWKSFFG